MFNTYKFLFYMILTITFFISSYDSKIIVFPLNRLNQNSDLLNLTDPSNFYIQKYKYNIYSQILLGTPSQNILVIFNSEAQNSLLTENINSLNDNNITYIPSKSSTFKNITSINNLRPTKRYSLINDTIKLYSDISKNNKIEVQNFQLELLDKFEYENTKNKTLVLDIGLNDIQEYNYSFLSQLKNKQNININIISFNNENLVIGEYPHQYDSSNYENSNIFSVDFSKNKYDSNYVMSANYVYLKKNQKRLFFSDTDIILYIDRNINLASDGYQESIKEFFFEEKINQNICAEKTVLIYAEEYNYIICNNTEKLKLEEFPSLYLEFNSGTFSFDYKDLFEEVNGTYYFLFLFSPEVKCWKMGDLFMKKYQYTFDMSKNTVSFYKVNENKGGSSFVVVLVIIILLAIVLGELFVIIRRRKQKNSDDIQNIDGPVMKEGLMG